MSAKEVKARQREVARAELSLLATEALAEKARLEEERTLHFFVRSQYTASHPVVS